MDDMWEDLLDKHGMTTASGEWNEFGFGSLCVQAAEKGEDEIALLLYSRDPESVRQGFEKYRRELMANLQGWWFSGRVWVSVCGPAPNAI